jgi:hypothetical protein
MTASENFVSRWARMKRESDTRNGTGEGGPQSEALPPDGMEAASGHQPTDAATEQPFDPASLPSIEAITATTDIRGFLQSRVPAELSRAALRRAWASDPAIRDFIGIAENQWDFNAPDAIAGFGPMLETDDTPAVINQLLGRFEELSDALQETPAPEKLASPAADDPGRSTADRNVQLALAGFPSSNVGSLSENASEEDTTRQNVSAEDEPSRKHRSHGSALPR